MGSGRSRMLEVASHGRDCQYRTLAVKLLFMPLLEGFAVEWSQTEVQNKADWFCVNSFAGLTS
jgi:hypothetical protein